MVMVYVLVRLNKQINKSICTRHFDAIGFVPTGHTFKKTSTAELECDLPAFQSRGHAFASHSAHTGSGVTRTCLPSQFYVTNWMQCGLRVALVEALV
jgi:hypothetical protein